LGPLTGSVTEELKKYLEAVSGKHSIESLKKSCIKDIENNKESAAI
jgi:hypothetical protein